MPEAQQPPNPRATVAKSAGGLKDGSDSAPARAPLLPNASGAGSGGRGARRPLQPAHLARSPAVFDGEAQLRNLGTERVRPPPVLRLLRRRALRHQLHYV